MCATNIIGSGALFLTWIFIDIKREWKTIFILSNSSYASHCGKIPQTIVQVQKFHFVIDIDGFVQHCGLFTGIVQSYRLRDETSRIKMCLNFKIPQPNTTGSLREGNVLILAKLSSVAVPDMVSSGGASDENFVKIKFLIQY